VWLGVIPQPHAPLIEGIVAFVKISLRDRQPCVDKTSVGGWVEWQVGTVSSFLGLQLSEDA
jgi:hypothetical protein